MCAEYMYKTTTLVKQFLKSVFKDTSAQNANKSILPHSTCAKTMQTNFGAFCDFLTRCNEIWGEIKFCLDFEDLSIYCFSQNETHATLRKAAKLFERNIVEKS